LVLVALSSQQGRKSGFGVAGYVCSGDGHADHRKTPYPEKPEWRILNAQSSTWKLSQQRGATGRQICGEGLRFDGENVHHPNPAIWCTGTETNFRVKVAGHESNCKILAELFKGVG
jgi:hypothetical protein